MHNAEFFIQKLMSYYNVSTILELSKKIDIGQPSISKWKINNSINAIKKKCRELGIYDNIFGDSSVSITQGNGGRAAGRDYQENNPTNSKLPSQEFEELTISLIKNLIEKLGEEELQYKLMELKKNA